MNMKPPVTLLKLSNELARIAVTYRPPADLMLTSDSPRVHTARQIKQIARSISVFGFLIPIIIDEGGRVLVGAGRLMAAMELGFAEVPTVQVTHLSEAQKKAFACLITDTNWNGPRFFGLRSKVKDIEEPLALDRSRGAKRKAKSASATGNRHG
jgi:hypothetical protein